MAVNNLWGDLNLDEPFRAPADILKEQISVLASVTKGVLSGDLLVMKDGPGFVLQMLIIAPALDNYRYHILNVNHGIELYPARVTDFASGEKVVTTSCQNEEDITQVFGSILGSDRVRRIIRSLVAQSKAL